MEPNSAEIGVFQALGKALGQFDDPKIQRIVWKSLFGALVIFALLGLGLWFLAGWLAAGLAHWVDWIAHFGTLILTVALSWFLFPVAVTAVGGPPGVAFFRGGGARRGGAPLPPAPPAGPPAALRRHGLVRLALRLRGA